LPWVQRYGSGLAAVTATGRGLGAGATAQLASSAAPAATRLDLTIALTPDSRFGGLACRLPQKAWPVNAMVNGYSTINPD
jgi:hypothetical protein